MKKTIQRIGFILFWQLLSILLLLRLPKDLYTEWAIAFAAFTILLIWFSFRFVPGSRTEAAIQKLRAEYEKFASSIEDIRTQSLRLEMNCPSCKEKGNYWSFIEDYKCDKCGSDLWVTTLKEYDQEYTKLFEKRDKAFTFTQRLSPRMRRKIRRMRGNGF